MPRLTIKHTDDPAELDHIHVERDDVVLERLVAPGHFELAEGPFNHYQRLIEPDDNGHVTEHIRYELAIPWFGWAFALLTRRALRRRPDEAGRQPWWAPPQRLDARASTMLGILAAAAVLTGYLGTLLGQTLTFVADEFELSRTDQGIVSAWGRLGTLLAIGVVALADRQGRRKIAVLATAAGAIGAVATAAAPNAFGFVAAQVVMRTFSAALGTVILVYAVEEMPAGARAYALSLMGMASALGAGMVLWVLPIADLATEAWRIAFVPPVLALPLAWSFHRNLPESKWYRSGSSEAKLSDRIGPLLVLAAITFSIALYLAPADQFRNEFLRDERGFSAGQITLFVLTTATPGGLGLLIAGRMADTVGRKVVLAVATALGLGALTLVFNTTGVAMWLLALAAAIFSSGLLPSLGVYRGELFPSNVRNRAVGWISASGVAGAVCGLALTGWLSDRWGSIGSVIAVLWLAPLAGLVLALVALPETIGRSLEELNPEDYSPS
ncbi:MAG: MFS transporter [Actinomycetia bacterium]|nr:MFS transporter [Actinomycetes bacterium]